MRVSIETAAKHIILYIRLPNIQAVDGWKLSHREGDANYIKKGSSYLVWSPEAHVEGPQASRL